jgi:hypothetical protein
MSLANCKHCGQLYLQQRSAYCVKCQELHDGYYLTMRNYLKTNPRSTVLDIHENTGIPLSKVLEIRNETYVPFGQ